MRLRTSIASALILLVLTAGVVLGHHVNSISGIVDCDGDYVIVVNGDVYNTTNLIVTLNGVTIFDSDTGQSGPATPDADYIFAGSGAVAGQEITAKAADNSFVATGSLVLTQEVCVEETPAPTPIPSLPDTGLSLTPNFAEDGLIVIGIAFLLGAAVLITANFRRSRR